MEKLNYESAIVLIREHCGEYSVQCCFHPLTHEEHFNLSLHHSNGKTYIYQILDKREYEKLIFYLLQSGANYHTHIGTYKFRKNEDSDK